MEMSWVATGCSVVTAIIAFAAWKRNGNQDSKSFVDERIKVTVGIELAEIKSALNLMNERIPSRDMQNQDNQKIIEVLRRIDQHDRDLNECFQRLRAVEQSCARNGHGAT